MERQTWFTSDTHYGHKNICKGVSEWTDLSKTRPFKTIEEMNDTIVKRINEKVGKDDVLYHLGDWSFGGFENVELFRKRIVCENIHLILGNHDHHIERNKGDVQRHFLTVSHYSEVMIDSVKLVLMHYPIASWKELQKGRIHLHGHVHLNHKDRLHNGKCMDVGIDGSPNFYPINFKEILKLMNQQQISSYLKDDHHA